MCFTVLSIFLFTSGSLMSYLACIGLLSEVSYLFIIYNAVWNTAIMANVRAGNTKIDIVLLSLNNWLPFGKCDLIIIRSLIWYLCFIEWSLQKNIADMQKYEMSRRQVFGTRKIITGGQSRCGHRDTRAQLPPQFVYRNNRPSVRCNNHPSV